MSTFEERLKNVLRIVEINRIVDWEQFSTEQIQEEFRQIELIAKGNDNFWVKLNYGDNLTNFKSQIKIGIFAG